MPATSACACGDGFLITPTDACLGFLEPARLAKVDADGALRRRRPPEKSLALHRAHLRRRCRRRLCDPYPFDPSGRALTGRRRGAPDDVLPPITPYYVMKVGHVPIDSVSAARRRRGGRAWWPLAIERQRARRRADPGRAARAPRPECLASQSGRGDGRCSRSSRRRPDSGLLGERRAEPLSKKSAGIEALRQRFGAAW